MDSSLIESSRESNQLRCFGRREDIRQDARREYPLERIVKQCKHAEPHYCTGSEPVLNSQPMCAFPGKSFDTAPSVLLPGSLVLLQLRR